MDNNTVSLSRIPPHIPEHLVYDFDFLHDEALTADFATGAEVLAARAPDFFWTPRNGGHWVAKGRQAVFDVAREFALFTSVNDQEIDQAVTLRIPIRLDPPAHTPFRRPFNLALSPKMVAGMMDAIRALVVQLVEGVKPAGTCEFVSQVAVPLPVFLFMRMVGLPDEDYVEFRRTIQQAFTTLDLGERKRLYEHFNRLTEGFIRERTAAPGDDVVSQMIMADVGGRRPTFEEIQSMVLMLFGGGLDTVANSLALGVRHLAMHPELQAQIREDPSRIVDLVEELLRRFAVANPLRWVAQDADYEGISLRRGELVMMCPSTANVDPRFFADPSEIRLGRSEAHLSFGAGAHRCPGSHLARAELQIFFEEWFRRIPEFRVDPETPVAVHPALVFSVDSLGVNWTPRTGG